MHTATEVASIHDATSGHVAAVPIDAIAAWIGGIRQRA